MQSRFSHRELRCQVQDKPSFIIQNSAFGNAEGFDQRLPYHIRHADARSLGFNGPMSGDVFRGVSRASIDAEMPPLQPIAPSQLLQRLGDYRFHPLNEMRIDDLSEDDIINGILTGEIIEDQFDIDYQDTKYIIYGDALDGREIGLVAKMDRYGNVAIITAYWLKLSDYE